MRILSLCLIFGTLLPVSCSTGQDAITRLAVSSASFVKDNLSADQVRLIHHPLIVDVSSANSSVERYRTGQAEGWAEVLSGDVHIRLGNLTLTCDTAVWMPGFHLLTSPHLTLTAESGSQIIGDQWEFNLEHEIEYKVGDVRAAHVIL